jgi:hypothetical protein
MRAHNPFTARQINLLKTLSAKLQDIDNRLITHVSYQWKTQPTRCFGKIPKITFTPHSCYVKAQIIYDSGTNTTIDEQTITLLRKKYGIKKVRYSQARLFESELNNIMFKIKKALHTLAFINNLFSDNDTLVAEPISMLQQIVMEENMQIFNEPEDTA